MVQILEAATLARLLDAAPEDVRRTIETGAWAGCIWPGHPEWEIYEACVQIRSLALHYFTVRYPAAEAHRRDIAAQLLASQGCPQGGAAHLEAVPLVDQALLWLWALAGGPAAPNVLGDGELPPKDSRMGTAYRADHVGSAIFAEGNPRSWGEQRRQVERVVQTPRRAWGE